MKPVDATWSRSAKVYWSLLWRLAIYLVVPLAALAAGVYEIDQRGLLAGTGVPSFVPPLAGAIAGCLVLLLTPVFVVKRVLRQAYSDFRIVLEGNAPKFRIEPQLGGPPGAPRQPQRPAAKPAATQRSSQRIEPSFSS